MDNTITKYQYKVAPQSVTDLSTVVWKDAPITSVLEYTADDDDVAMLALLVDP